MELIKSTLNKLKKSQLFKDSFWSLLGNVAGKGLALLAGILVARFLGKDVYGEYGIIRNTILTIGVFSTFGLGYTATKFIAEYRKSSPEKIPMFIKQANKITLFFSGFMALLLFVFADYVALEWLGAMHLAIPLKILSVLIVFNAITTTQIGVLSGFGKFKALAKINTIIGVFTFLFSVVLTFFYALNGALLALLIIQILNSVFNYYVVKRETKHLMVKNVSDDVMLKEIINFSAPIAIREGTYSISSWLVSLIIIIYSSTGELGLYSAAIQWNAIVLFIPGVLKSVMLSHFSSSLDDSTYFNKTLKQTLLINFGSTFFLSVFIMVLSGFIESFYGVTFYGLKELITLSVFITIFSSTSGVFVQSFISFGKNWLMLFISLIRDVGILFVGFIFINHKIYSGARSIIMSSLLMNMLFLIIVFITYRILKKNEKTSLYN